MYNYCTLFDTKYLSRGLALYKSLVDCGAEFQLYILAMDNAAARELQRLNLPGISVLNLEEIEDPELLQAKSTRTRQEYCWTCTPSLINYCLEKFALPECTYLDADVFFFANPEILQQELRSKSVVITEHHYAPEYDQSETSGRFCVQYVTFRNDVPGRTVLNSWRQSCNEWCFARIEDGKFGDQKYLDYWPDRFPQVHVLANRGGGAAPWNLRSYDLTICNGQIILQELRSDAKWPLVFYHFHDFRFSDTGMWFHKGGLSGYHIGRDAYEHIYGRYLLNLYESNITYQFAIKTDLPAIPDTLDKSEFEDMILPALDSSAERKKLRSEFVFTENMYLFRRQAARETDLDTFRLLIKARYNLDRYALWHYPGNYVHELLRSLELRLQNLETKVNRVKNNPFIKMVRRIFPGYFS